MSRAASDEHGNSILHLACASDVDGDEKVVAIAKRRQNLDGQANQHGQLPIHLAAVNKDPQVLRTLLNNKYAPCVRVNAPNKAGKTPLHLAVSSSNNDNITTLLLHPLTDVSARDVDGNTPSHLAEQVENVNVTKRLKTHSSYQPDVRNNKGFTPEESNPLNQCLLQYAQNGTIKNVDVMISEGAQSITDNQGNTPLHLAVTSKIDTHEKTASLIRLDRQQCSQRNKSGLCPVHVLLKHRSSNLDMLKTILLEEPSCTNLTDSRQRTPLHYAVTNGRIDIVGLLLAQSNVDVNAQNYAGETAYFLAERMKDKGILKLFVKRSDLKTTVKT